MRRVALLLGSNVEPERHVPAAIAALRSLGRLAACGSAWRSAPAGGAVGPDFWNVALILETALDPAALKSSLREVEGLLGRIRPAPPLSPRTIDIDVLGADGVVFTDELARWAHVAVPLAEIAPQWTASPLGATVASVAAGLRAGARIERLGGAPAGTGDPVR